MVMLSGHVGMVSSPNHNFSCASMTKRLTSISCSYFHFFVTDNNPSRISGSEENGRRNYFMINLGESMGPESNSRPLDLQSVTLLDTRPGVLFNGEFQMLSCI